MLYRFRLDTRFLSSSKIFGIVLVEFRLLDGKYRRLDPRFVEVVLGLRIIDDRYNDFVFLLLEDQIACTIAGSFAIGL